MVRKNKINIIDAGSRGGLPVPWKNEYINRLICIDPQPLYTPSCAQLMKFCVFHEEGIKKFYITKKKECSSLFKPDYRQIQKHFGIVKSAYRIVKIDSIECHRIENILDDEYDFLKTDLQGADLCAIQSCGIRLKEFVGIQSESLLFPFYKNAPSLIDLLSYMEKSDFSSHKLFCKDGFFSEYLFLNNNTTKYDKLSLVRRIYKI